jgi:hypothetical protein
VVRFRRWRESHLPARTATLRAVSQHDEAGRTGNRLRSDGHRLLLREHWKRDRSTVTVTVDPGDGEIPEAVLIMSTGSSELVEAAPFTATVQIPADALGTTALRAIAFYGEGPMAAAAPVALDVQTGATIASIEVVNGDQISAPRRQILLRVSQCLAVVALGDMHRATIEERAHEVEVELW